MRDYFTIDGISSGDFGVFVAETNQFDAPKRDVQTVAVPGRNGTLTIDNGRYENQPKWYKAYVAKDIKANLAGLRDWILSKSGYRVLKDTLYPEESYQARYISGLEVDESDRIGAYFKIDFDRMPQRFLDAGNQIITLTAAGSIRNKYQEIALPLIRAYGTGIFSINGVTVRITSASEYTDIDCELQEAYKDTLATDKNSCVVLTNGVFPSLVPGANGVTMSGITRLEITPRWWMI